MAGEEELGDEIAIEELLESQTKEQKESLVAVEEALASDPSNPELLSVHEELIAAIKDAEEGLLHLKRSRLLREADEIAGKLSAQSNAEEDAGDVEPDGKQEEEQGHSELGDFSVDSKCRFRHTNGRWYDGRVVGIEDTGIARVSFLTPTSESMQICKFFMQQRCRFGNNCRMSHGLSMHVSSLKEYIPTLWGQSFVGNSVWVTDPFDRSAIWKEAELESWDDQLKLAHVVFLDGSAAKVGSESLALSEYAQMTDEDEDYSSSEFSGSDEEMYSENESGNPGLGNPEGTSQRGVQSETTLFATWETHTRGIASKMMANMGYREGMGLGASGQGMVNPIPVKILKAKQSLDLAVQSSKANEGDRIGGKKRSRGGKRKRDKKYAEATRAAKAHQESEPDVFRFINEQLAGQLGNKNDSGQKQRSEPQEGRKKEDRKSLVEYGDKVNDLRVHVEKLEEMVNRNRNDKVVHEAALRRLKSAQKELADAEVVHASASNAVVSKEKEKKWLRF